MQPQAAPRVLILTASVGAGHVRAAEAVELALKEIDPGAHVRNVDLMTCATAVFRRMYSKWYLDLVSHAPHLLGYFYDLTDRAPSNSTRDTIRVMVEQANLARLDPILNDPQGWDIVVNTHFLPAEIIARRRRKKKPTNVPRRFRVGEGPASASDVAPQFTVVTDFDAHGLWVNDPTDHYFVATDEAAISLGRWGVPRERITISGIPVHPVFAKPLDARAARAKHDLPQDKPVILLLAGGFGVGPVETLFDAAMHVKRPIHLAVVCGKNDDLKARLQRAAKAAPHTSTIIGFTREMDELMAAATLVVSKPGGLTTSEILARGAAMAIVNPIPGQESRNSDYLLENTAAIKINSAAVLPHKLNQLLANESRLAALRQNAKALGRPRAAYDVARAVLAAAGASGRDA